MTTLEKLEFIHFVLQENQEYFKSKEGYYNFDIEHALNFVEELREPHFTE